MYSAISGLKTHQTMLDVTANDIANVNTVGYKGSRTTFTDQLSQMQRGAAAPTPGGLGGANAAQVGLGTQLGSIDNLMGTGALQNTNNALDLAIQGDGWFRVTTRGPGDPATPALADANAEAFTRAGNFTRNADGYLVTQGGAYLMGKQTPDAAENIAIQVPNGASNMTIAQSGEVTFVPPGGGARVSAGFVSLAKFPNEGGLERAAGNLWRVSAASGPETPAGGSVPGANGTGLTIAGTVEMSNVDLASEFTEMISAQRGFQANSRVISTSDEMLQDLVNLKR
jgi:flagellar hook protein FlgE